MEWKPLPVGIDDFEKIVTGDYFYVDKTLLIKELLVGNCETSSQSRLKLR